VRAWPASYWSTTYDGVDDYLQLPGFQYVKGISMWVWLRPDELQPTVQAGKALYLVDARGTDGTVTLATGAPLRQTAAASMCACAVLTPHTPPVRLHRTVSDSIT
jgi:hypothetical protein